MRKYDIVVARYNEDVEWVNEFSDSKFNLKIYNKGEDNISVDAIKLENLGRDPHTFITYIIDNYNDLPDYVVFLQGNPFDHQKNVIDVIKNHNNEDYVFLSDHVIDESIVSWYEHLVELTAVMTYPNMRRYSLSETSNVILGSETPNKCRFAAGQQYIVDKKYILNRDIDFYKNVLEHFKLDFVLPWHIERLWFNIFKF
jgi:hypothetical protein